MTGRPASPRSSRPWASPVALGTQLPPLSRWSTPPSALLGDQQPLGMHLAVRAEGVHDADRVGPRAARWTGCAAEPPGRGSASIRGGGEGRRPSRRCSTPDDPSSRRRVVRRARARASTARPPGRSRSRAAEPAPGRSTGLPSTHTAAPSDSGPRTRAGVPSARTPSGISAPAAPACPPRTRAPLDPRAVVHRRPVPDQASAPTTASCITHMWPTGARPDLGDRVVAPVQHRAVAHVRHGDGSWSARSRPAARLRTRPRRPPPRSRHRSASPSARPRPRDGRAGTGLRTSTAACEAA